MPRKKKEEEDSKTVKKTPARAKSKAKKEPEQKIQEELESSLSESRRLSLSILEDGTSFAEIYETEDTFSPAEIQNQIELLTQRIAEVDKRFKEENLEYKKTVNNRAKLQKQRSKVKKFIQVGQDLIYDAEQRLLNVDPDQYRPDLPDFFRPLIQFLTGKDDEVVLRRIISDNSVKISQRNTRLITINKRLSTLLLTEAIYSNSLDALKTVNEEYRSIRMDLGKSAREAFENWKAKRTEQAQNEIVQAYVETLKNLKMVGTKFSMAISRAKEDSEELFGQVRQLKPDNLNVLVSDLLKNESPEKIQVNFAKLINDTDEAKQDK